MEIVFAIYLSPATVGLHSSQEISGRATAAALMESEELAGEKQ